MLHIVYIGVISAIMFTCENSSDKIWFSAWRGIVSSRDLRDRQQMDLKSVSRAKTNRKGNIAILYIMELEISRSPGFGSKDNDRNNNN